MRAATKEAYELIHNGLIALNRASKQGVCIDVQYCRKMEKALTKKIQRYKNNFNGSKIGRLWHKTYAKVNLASDQQLSNILFDKLKIRSIKKTQKGNASIDNEVLENIVSQYPEIDLLIKIKKYEKVLSTYIQGFLKLNTDGIIHPSFFLHTARTYRSSCAGPNLQNIPKRDEDQRRICRQAIIPRKGHQLVTADYSGIEVAISQCYHQDPNMLEYIKNPASDMHADMAIQIYMLDEFEKSGTEKILRNGAKNGFVFPQFYGDYYGNNALSLAKWAELPVSGRFNKKHGLVLKSGKTVGHNFVDKGIKCYNDFEEHIKNIEYDFWNKRFKVYKQWKINNVKRYMKNGYLKMKTGFTCSGIMGKNDINNYPIQGSAFHCLLNCLMRNIS